MKQAVAVPSRKRLFEDWVWLFPATYLVHLMEEYWGGEGFYRWTARITGRGMTPSQFIVINSVALLLMLIGILLFRKTPSIRWLTTSFATVVLINGFAHLSGSILTNSYSPGVLSGTLIWIPLGAITLYRAWQHATRRSFFYGFLVGIMIHAAILLVLIFIR